MNYLKPLLKHTGQETTEYLQNIFLYHYPFWIVLRQLVKLSFSLGLECSEGIERVPL